MNTFQIRPYTKRALAGLYFPESHPRTAVNHLMSWIRRCTHLHEQLKATGYTTTDKIFTPRQVSLIIDYLGEP
ncbi:MAG: DUF4248 domain-containing protein [Bacteroidaceae bacterium]|nr:DUF4248 domain-containing protein [Bacteroidaceae bacterium]MBR7028109.1 DUF4248 domain-containing protein [Bacteroidaceae bacterium]